MNMGSDLRDNDFLPETMTSNTMRERERTRDNVTLDEDSSESSFGYRALGYR